MGCEGELEKRGCKVVMIIKGTPAEGRRWLDTFKFPFPLILDPELNVFKHLGLKRSLKRVWRISTMRGYAETVLREGAFPGEPYEDDDIHLRAGDYITNSSGKLVYAFNASYSHDRPSAEEILRSRDAVEL